MAHASIRIQFQRQRGADEVGRIAWFSPGVAKALVAAGAGTALDAIPAGAGPDRGPFAEAPVRGRPRARADRE